MHISQVGVDGGARTVYSHAAGKATDEIARLVPALAMQLDGPAIAAALAAPLATDVTAEGEVAMGLQRFLSASNQDAGWVRVLKCMHQEMLAPAVVRLRLAMHAEGVNYKDARGA